MSPPGDQGRLGTSDLIIGIAAMRVDPAYYRAKAAQTLQLASKTRDPDTKAYLLKVAAEYEKLADEVEQRGN